MSVLVLPRKVWITQNHVTLQATIIGGYRQIDISMCLSSSLDRVLFLFPYENLESMEQR